MLPQNGPILPTRVHEEAVFDSTKPLRVTLAWTDAPGNTTGNAYNNDLNLTLTLGGQTYLGNVFTGATSSPGGTADPRNNVESIVLPAGFTGPFTITVTAANITSDGVPNNGDALDQDFALVIYNATDREVLPVNAGATITAESCTPNQGAVDPGETVTVQLALQNLGPSNTTALVATLLPLGGVLQPGAPQNYGVLTGNGGPAVSRGFTFLAGGDCGSLLKATLQLQDGTNDYGTVEFPFRLGLAVTNLARITNSTAIAIGATDGVVTPYPSTAVVSGLAGQLEHLTVTLHGLSHTWPDDLDVLLVSPAGRAVMLCSDAGGGAAVSGLSLTFDDRATNSLPDSAALTSGTWAPVDWEPGEALPAPAPNGPYALALSELCGANPNGVWQLFVADDYGSDDGGAIAGGWTLQLVTTNSICCVDPSSADLAVTLQDASDPTTISNVITYTVTITNRGPAAATSVVLTNLVSPLVAVTNVTVSQGSFSPAGNRVICQLGTVAAGSAATVVLRAVVLAGPELVTQATVTAAQPDGNPVDNTASATTTVLVPAISIQDTSVIEGDSGTTYAVFVVALAQPTGQTIAVDWFTTNGTAAAGVDYLAQSNHLTFLPGEIVHTLLVPVIPDVLDEANETFRVILANPVNVTGTDLEAVATIIDNDPLPAISIGDAAVVEGNSGTTNATFALTLSAPSGRELSVACSTTNGTALVGQDYAAVLNRVVAFAPGQTVSNLTVAINGDTQVEPNETFLVALSHPTNAVLGTATGVGTIVTDDIAPLVQAVGYRIVAEAGGVTNGNFDPGETVTISLALVNPGSAPTTNLVATLAATGGVAAPSGPQTYGVLPGGGPQASRPFTFTVGLSNCGALTLTFAFADNATALGSTNYASLVGGCFFDDFEPGLDLVQWSAFGGSVGSTVLATNYGGSVSPVNSLWFGDDGSRFATTRPINTTEGGSIRFNLRLANGASSGQWEQVDLPAEGVGLEYSSNGSTWFLINNYTNATYYNWTAVTELIPSAAQTAGTLFRWRQLSHSGSCCDHWALDDVFVLTGPQPPSLLTPLQNITAAVGSSPTFTANASGSNPLRYQWRWYGTNLPGATGSALTLFNVQSNQMGPYSVVVTNLYGAVTSAAATLTVIDGITVAVFDDPAFVDTGGSTSSESDNVQASLTNAGFFVTPFLLADTVGAAASGNVLLFPEQEVASLAPSLSPVQRAAISNAVSAGGVMIVNGQGTYGATLLNTLFGLAVVESGQTGGGTIFYRSALAAGTGFADDPATITGNNGQITLSRASLPAGALPIYTNGTQCVVVELLVGSGKVIYLGWDWFDGRPRGTQDNGWLAVLTSAVLERTPPGPTPPSIRSEPASLTTMSGGTATFSVGVVGSSPLSYQWRFHGTNLPAATQPALTLLAVTTNQAGPYSVVVTNAYGSATSAVANLTVLDASSAFFDDFEPGIDLVQWSAFGGSIGGTVLATNFGGSVSPVNSLWFGDSGSRFATTRSLDTTSGGSINFNLRLANGGTSGQWETVDLPGEGVVLEYSVDGGGSWTSVDSYTNSSFYSWTAVSRPIPAGAQSPATYFRWRQLSHSGSCCDHWALDDVLLATGPQPPSIVTHPSNVVTSVGGTALFSVVAAGSNPLAYQWRCYGTNLPGQASSALPLINVQSNQVGPYTVVVTNGYGAVTSAVATLTLLPQGAGVAYLRAAVGTPWNSSANEAALDRVFGVGTWQDQRFETVGAGSLFSPANAFIFMDGSDSGAIELEAFLTANRGLMESWVASGGRLFLNCAPNEDNGMYFGFGANLIYPDASTEARGAAPGHPIFNGPFLPVGTNWTGGSFAHATVTGTNLTVLLTNSANGRVVLAEQRFGSGRVLFGGMTTHNFHSPTNEAANLRANLLAYGSSPVVISNQVPVITSPPSSLAAAVGTVANFLVTATGPGPLTYQWRKDGTNLAASGHLVGAQSNHLSLVTVQPNDAGSYSVVVSNAFGFATSSNAVLTVLSNLSLVVGLAPPGDTNEYLSLRTTLTSLGFAVQDIGPGQWSGVNVVVAYPGAGTASFGPTRSEISNGVNFVQISDWGSDWTANSFTTVSPTGITVSVSSPHPITTGLSASWATFGFWHYGTAVEDYVGWSTDATLPSLMSATFPVSQARILTAATLGAGRAVYAGWNLYGADATTNDVALLRNAILWAADQPAGTAPTITNSPVSRSVFVGDAVSFSVGVQGRAPLYFQWLKGGTALPLQTNAALNLANVQTNDAGSYAVAISNAFGTVTSAAATLTVIDPAGLRALIIWDTNSPGTVALSNALASAGLVVALSATDETGFDGTNPGLSGQQVVIHLNGTTYNTDMPVAGQVAISNFVASGGGYIHGEWNTYEFSSSTRLARMRDLILFDRTSGGTGPLTITNVPGFATHPILAHVPASFSVEAGYNIGPAHAFAVQPVTVLARDDRGSAAVAVREFGAGRVVGFNIAPNYLAATLANPNVMQLHVDAARWAARLTGTPPAITAQPTNLVTTAGSTVRFAAGVSGSLPQRYQWRHAGTNLPAGTDLTLVLTNVSFSAAGDYSLTVSNDYGFATSSNALLTVLPPVVPPVLQGRVQSNWFVISFNSTPGLAYVVDYLNLLGPGPWATLTNVVATGTNTVCFDRIVTPQRFYRVRLLGAPAELLQLRGSVTGTQFLLAFNARTGRSYTVEYATGPGAWWPLTNLVAPDTNVIIADPISWTQRFYRVVTPAN